MLWEKTLQPFKLYDYYPLAVVGDTFMDMMLDSSSEAVIRICRQKTPILEVEWVRF